MCGRSSAVEIALNCLCLLLYIPKFFTRLLNLNLSVMKTFRYCFVLFACLLASTFTFATADDLPGATVNSELRKEVAKLVEAPALSKNGVAEAMAFINFTVNENYEIVVLNVVSEHEFIKEYITKSLNRQQVKIEGLQPYTEYNIKFEFRSEKA